MENSEFEKFKLRGFKRWDLFLHKNQYPYLGRCYALTKREGVNLITDMDVGEQLTLFNTIIPLWHEAIKNFLDDSYEVSNITFLRNTTKNLHVDLIPRLSKSIKRYRIEFIDRNPNGNYSPYDRREFSEGLLMQIKEDFSISLERVCKKL